MDGYSDEPKTFQSHKWDLRSDSRRPLPELIEAKLRELIESGELIRGQQLPNEPELARRMGVARSSVRTALQRLEVLKMVEVRRGRGWFVRHAQATDPQTSLLGQLAEHRLKIGEVLEVRMALEGTAASLAAVRATPGELDDIAKLASAHVNAPPSDIDELVRTDEEFHESVVRASRNELLLSIYRVIVPELVEFRRDGFADRGIALRSATEHHTVVTFLKRRDPAGAKAAMTAHLLGLYREIQLDSEDDDSHVPLSTFVDHEDEPDWPQRPVGR